MQSKFGIRDYRLANLLSENAIGERWSDATGWSFFAKDSVNGHDADMFRFLKPHP